MGSEYMSVDFTHPKKYMGKIYLSQIKQNPWKTKGLNGANRETRTPDPMVPNHVRYQTALHLEVLIKYLFGGPSGTRTPDLPVMSRAL